MTERVLELVRTLSEVQTEEESLLLRLCEAAEAELRGSLRCGVSVEDCRSAFETAAAWLVLAGLCVSRQEEGITAWSAGEVSVKRGVDAGAQAAIYRGQAERLMRPYCADRGFAFLGVRG